MTSRDPVENSAPTGHQITTRSYTEGLRHLRGHSQVDGRRWPNELDVHHVLNVVRRQVHNLSLPGRHAMTTKTAALPPLTADELAALPPRIDAATAARALGISRQSLYALIRADRMGV